MSLKTTEMWIHGNQIVIEDWFQMWLKQELVMKQDNDGQLFLVSTLPTPSKQVEYLFHIPIPTPSIDGKRPLLNKIFIEYSVGEPPESTNKTTCAIYISEVHIYNGNKWLNNSNPIWKKVNKQETKWDKANAPFLASLPKIDKNLGVTVRVVFGDPSSGKFRGIKFYSAGAEFAIKLAS